MTNEEIKVLTMQGFQRAMQTVDAELETKLEGVSVNGKLLTVKSDRTVNIDLSKELSNYATKSEVVTKEDMSVYATKEDLRRVLEELLESLR